MKQKKTHSIDWMCLIIMCDMLFIIEWVMQVSSLVSGIMANHVRLQSPFSRVDMLT